MSGRKSLLTHVEAVANIEVSATNSISGTIEKPSTGSILEPVVNAKTFSRVTGGLLPAVMKVKKEIINKRNKRTWETCIPGLRLLFKICMKTMSCIHEKTTISVQVNEK